MTRGASAQVSRSCLRIHVKMPDAQRIPETVLLRLITSQGRPNVKLAATEPRAGQVLGGESDPTMFRFWRRVQHFLEVE